MDDTPTPDDYRYIARQLRGYAPARSKDIPRAVEALDTAADEIERLRAALVGWFAASDTWNGHAVWCDYEDDGCDCGKEALSDDR